MAEYDNRKVKKITMDKGTVNTARIFEIQKNSIVDGPGIRTTVFFKGCNMKCRWCHNPESQNHNPEMMFYKDKCTGCDECKKVCKYPDKCILCGECVSVCVNNARKISGRTITCEEAFREIESYKIFYDASGGGVTFSGGECMLQADFLQELMKKCRDSGIHTAIDTAGNVEYKNFQKVIPYTDMFLYDIKCFSEDLHIWGTGFSNKLILSNLKRLSKETDAEIIIRIPIIGGYNDNLDELGKVRDFIKKIRVNKIELLKYHNMAKYKYDALNMQNTEFSVPLDGEMEKYRNFINN